MLKKQMENVIANMTKRHITVMNSFAVTSNLMKKYGFVQINS